MITIKNLSKKAGKKVILQDVNLNIEGIYGLIGPNGAGKTTLMRALAGLIEINSGEIHVELSNLDNNSLKDIRGEIGYLPQDFNLYPKVTIWDCLNHLAILKGLKNKKERTERINLLLEKVNLTDHKNKKIKDLSGGMRKRVGIIQMLLSDPQILIIDEPTAGLDIHERIRFRNLIRSISKEKIIIISSHIVEDVEFLCNKIGILKQGKVIAEGTPKEISSFASNNVWEIPVDICDLEKVFNAFSVIDLEQVDENVVKVKVLSSQKPLNGKNIRPKIIDGYLTLINEKVEG